MSHLLALALGTLVLTAARFFRWLTPSGTMAAAAVGLAVLVGAGPFGVVLLLFFFLTSSVLVRLRAARTARTADREGRNGAQVVANGGVAAVASLAALAGWVPEAQYALAGAVAAATADTWATEVGSAGGWPVWSVIGRGRVPTGTSGGVSLPGTLAAAAGAVGIGLLAALAAEPVAAPDLGWVGLAGLAGMAGIWADSLLGATLEGRLGLLNNDGVNVGCTVIGGLLGWALGTG